MNLPQTCDPDRLDAFVRGELSEQQESALTAHLDQCETCGEELERRVAAADQWREASELLTHRMRRSNVVDLANDPSTNGSLATSTPFAEQMDQVVGMLAPTDDPEMLGRIGGYEVSGVIGCGGMGVVFKAHDRSLDRVVAVKVMAPHLAGSGAARKRFARESKAAAAVLHPNVIAIHCVADDPKLPYLVMPYIGGASLQKRIEADGPLCTQDTLRIGQQIAAGLAAAHAQGLVHRDIKPANILLERGVERVTITDFGLARAVDDATMTRSGVIAGTPQYMSPEQARGESIDHRSDLFSLGSVLYMMCAGHSPFRAETTFGILRRITDNQPRPLREINPDVPEWLCAIIEKLHAKEPSERFQSAEEVAELLKDCLAHVQQPATTPLPTSVEQLSQLLPVATTAPQPAKKQLRQLFYNLPPIGKFIAAAAGAFALFFAGILIVLELDKGTLTIESELEDVPIRIMQGDAVVDRLTVTKSSNSVRVAAGTYVIELDTKLDGMVVENDHVALKRGATEQVKIRYSKTLINAKDGSSTFRFETPEALMTHAADCQTKGDGPGFMDCWTDQAFKDFVPSYLLTSIMQLQYSENAPHSKPRHLEELLELKQILAEEFGGNEAGKSLLALAMAHKEIADRSTDKFAEAAEATAENPLVQLLASGSAELINARSFIMKLSALHKKYEEPKAKKEPRVFAYTVEQDGDKAVATETTDNNKFGLIKTETGWRINDVFYGLKAKEESASLQGEWEFISAESDGVIKEYKTLKTQPSMARLTITGDMWTVKAGDGTNGMGSGGHRVEIDGNKLTFHGMTTMMPGMGSNSNDEIPTIGYGLWQVDGDTLTYLMTPAVAESALDGQSEPPIQFPDSFETKGTENNVFRLRRIHPSSPPASTSSTNSSTPKSSPQFPPVKIVVHDEEGKPLEGVKVSLYQLAKDQGGQVLEINETSNASGMAVNRNLPYGHYELSATTADGWFLSGHGSKLNVEFEKGLSLKLVVPTPTPFGRLTIRDDVNLRLAGSAGLRFGTLEEVINNGPAFSVSPLPEPDGDLGEYSSFPTVTNGIEQVGIEIRFEMAKNISQPSPSGTHLNSKWKWTPVDKAKSSCRYLIVDGQARAFVNPSVFEDKPFHGLPMEECEMFKLPSAKHRVGGLLSALLEPTAMPLEIEIPAGEMSIYVERILGKPSLATMKVLNWEPHEDQPELWLEANVQRNSAWIERLFDTSYWIQTTLKPGYNEIAGHLQMLKLIRAGESLEVSLSPKPVDQKTSSASAARTLDDITSVYNEKTRQLRTELFTPPIPDLTTAQMRDAMLEAAEQYRKQGRVEVSSALKTSAETNRLADRLTFMGMTGTMSDGFRQITPQFNFESASNAALMVVLGKAELRYSRNGWSSKTWGDIDPPITGKWELVSVEQRGETLTQTAHDEWCKAHESWTELTIDQTSLTMAGDNAAKLDFSVDYDAGLLPQYTMRQDGNPKYSGVLMGNGFIDDNKLVIAVDIEGSSTPQTFHTTDGKSTNLTYRRHRMPDIPTVFQSHPKATDRVKRAFESAATVARKDDTTFNTLHLLAALMRDGSLPEVAEVAERKKISMTDLINRCDDAARVAERLFKATGDRGTGVSLTTSAQQWKELFEATELKAKEWKHDYLGPAHLLMAFIADDPLTKLFLKEQGIEAAEIRAMAKQIYFSPGRDAPVVRPLP
jgi:serine/threonine protein kinase